MNRYVRYEHPGLPEHPEHAEHPECRMLGCDATLRLRRSCCCDATRRERRRRKRRKRGRWWWVVVIVPLSRLGVGFVVALLWLHCCFVVAIGQRAEKRRSGEVEKRKGGKRRSQERRSREVGKSGSQEVQEGSTQGRNGLLLVLLLPCFRICTFDSFDRFTRPITSIGTRAEPDGCCAMRASSL